MTTITSTFASVLAMLGQFVSALFTGGETPGALYDLLPYVVIGVAFAIISFAIAKISQLCRGI